MTQIWEREFKIEVIIIIYAVNDCLKELQKRIILNLDQTCVNFWMTRNSRPEMFLRKDVLKICRKFTGEHPCWSVISIKLLCDFIETTLRHECSPVNLLHIFRGIQKIPPWSIPPWWVTPRWITTRPNSPR